SRRRHTRSKRDWSSDVCSSDLEANFLLVRFEKVKKLFEFLLQQGIVVRDRSSVPLCENSLRITVGKPEENRQILDAIKNFYQNRSEERRVGKECRSTVWPYSSK